MSRRDNKGFGDKIIQAVRASSKEPTPVKFKHWFHQWTEPASKRLGTRRELGEWLRAGLDGVPAESIARYLREMADDVDDLGVDLAISRFIDRVLPPLLSNEPPAED